MERTGMPRESAIPRRRAVPGPRRRAGGGRGGSLRSTSLLVLGLLLTTASLLIQGVSEGATSVRSVSPSRYSVLQVGSPSTVPVSVTGTTPVVATAALVALGAAGSQTTGVLGLAGTPTALPSCATATCRHQYIVASPVGLVLGNYSEQVNLSVTQPVAPPGVSQGFLIDIEIHLSTGWFAGRAYLATGTSTAAGGSVLTVELFMNLGGSTSPTIHRLDVTVDLCSSPTVCP